jgi:hypothetical protein
MTTIRFLWKDVIFQYLKASKDSSRVRGEVGGDGDMGADRTTVG